MLAGQMKWRGKQNWPAGRSLLISGLNKKVNFNAKCFKPVLEHSASSIAL